MCEHEVQGPPRSPITVSTTSFNGALCDQSRERLVVVDRLLDGVANEARQEQATAAASAQAAQRATATALRFSTAWVDSRE